MKLQALLLLALAAACPMIVQAADARTLKLIRHFLDTPTADLSPEDVPAFMDVEHKTLPKKLRTPYRAKREELLALKRIAEGNKKPPLRRLGQEELSSDKCEKPSEDPLAAAILKLAGYVEIAEDEEAWLIRKVRCTECELQTEFSLKLVLEKPRTKKGRARYFLHEKDPLMALVGAYRGGVQNPFGTQFFGVGHAACR